MRPTTRASVAPNARRSARGSLYPDRPILAGSSNGKTLGSGPRNWGSNPCPAVAVPLCRALDTPRVAERADAPAALAEAGTHRRRAQGSPPGPEGSHAFHLQHPSSVRRPRRRARRAVRGARRDRLCSRDAQRQNIQRRSIPANRVVDNALGGSQIDESKLGPVPVAQQALTAQTARARRRPATRRTRTTRRTRNARGPELAAAPGSRRDRVHREQRARGRSTSGDGRERRSAPSRSRALAAEKGIGGGAAWIVRRAPTRRRELERAADGLNARSRATGGTTNMTGWQRRRASTAPASDRDPARLRRSASRERRSRSVSRRRRRSPARCAPSTHGPMAPQPLGCGAERC